jgi:His/Glu/Gln/Arg/opine family amino acid ABC transporter permease subunit
MSFILEFLPFIVKGTYVTIGLSVCSVTLAVVFGLLGAWAKLSQAVTAQKIAGVYTTVVRGIPDLVLMLLVFYGGQILLNKVGAATGWWEYIDVNAFAAGIFSIAFIFGAYLTETFRGAYLSIPIGQIEAGVAIGLPPSKLFTRIILPHLIRYALPSFTNNWLTLMKTTALVSVIGLEDLVYNGFSAGRSTHQPFTFLVTVLVIYLILTALSEVGLRLVEAKYCRKEVMG